MKRVLFVSALTLILVAAMWGSAVSSGMPFGWRDPAGGGDDQPWGGEQQNDQLLPDRDPLESPRGYLPIITPAETLLNRLGIIRWFVADRDVSRVSPSSSSNIRQNDNTELQQPISGATSSKGN
jgi:hypothetical protein